MQGFDSSRPFLTREARAEGISERDLAGAAYQRLFRGCHIAAGVLVDHPMKCAAALKLVPSAYGVSHHSAAEAMGLEVPTSPHVHLVVPVGHQCRIAGIKVHRVSKEPVLHRHSALPTTTPERVLLDLAPELCIVDRTVIADAILRRRLSTPDRLRESASARTYAGRRVREALALADAAAESGMETRSRLLLHFAGLPAPTVNLVIGVGGSTRRIDLAYEEALLGIEYDGRHHRDRKEQWERDIGRREELEALGWRIVTLTAADIYTHPGRTLDRVRAALKARGVLVPDLDSTWRLHFSDREDYFAS